jgi:hypothetical protein
MYRLQRRGPFRAGSLCFLKKATGTGFPITCPNPDAIQTSTNALTEDDCNRLKAIVNGHREWNPGMKSYVYGNSLAFPSARQIK